MLLGLITTIYLIPNITGADKKLVTLEALAAEDKRVNNLMKRILRGRTDESLLTDEERRSEEELDSVNSGLGVERDFEHGGHTRDGEKDHGQRREC
jgi:hypothetical protein